MAIKLVLLSGEASPIPTSPVDVILTRSDPAVSNTIVSSVLASIDVSPSASRISSVPSRSNFALSLVWSNVIKLIKASLSSFLNFKTLLVSS